MGIDGVDRNVIDQIGFADHCLAADVDREEAEPRDEDPVEMVEYWGAWRIATRDRFRRWSE